jgi:hypothetical protein
MRNWPWPVPVAVFFLNPALACSDGPEFQYGAAEMRAAVEGDWSVTITPEGATTAMQVTVHVEQSRSAPAAAASPERGRTLVRAAHACGTRTLIKGAGACIDQTEMPLTVTYVAGAPAFASAMMSGKFVVSSLSFSIGNLNLNLASETVAVQVHADGSLGQAMVLPPSFATVTVTR